MLNADSKQRRACLFFFFDPFDLRLIDFFYRTVFFRWACAVGKNINDRVLIQLVSQYDAKAVFTKIDNGRLKAIWPIAGAILNRYIESDFGRCFACVSYHSSLIVFGTHIFTCLMMVLSIKGSQMKWEEMRRGIRVDRENALVRSKRGEQKQRSARGV
jgi:hypothetical protein